MGHRLDFVIQFFGFVKLAQSIECIKSILKVSTSLYDPFEIILFHLKLLDSTV